MSLFGHTSLSKTWIEDHAFNYLSFAEDNGWLCDVGALGVSFVVDDDAPVIAFGQNPGAKRLRQMAREQKQADLARKALEEQQKNTISD